MAFEKGDIVEYYREGILDWEETNEADQAGLVLGLPYTVEEYDPSDDSVKIKESVADLWLSAQHFRNFLQGS